MRENPLFEGAPQPAEPLAARMRPRTLDEFVGQDHILGEGRLLRRAIQADMISSIILYGPPGTGKTTLARVIANTTRSRFVSLNAVLAGVKDVREAIDRAKENRDLHGKRTILFVDEVHRWNKAQQDALLPWVENGTVILIGATTHNPFFEVNSALVSRSRIFQLKTLNAHDLRSIARRAISDPERGYGRYRIEIDTDALEHLVAVADGDARSLLGALQLAVETTPERFPPAAGTVISITREIAEESIQQKAVLYDKEGDYHFDVISAFIKSIRGSDPDATLYWLAKMVHSGEAPHYLFRRMLISASEDVGLADPGALGIVEAAAAAFDRVGLPEGNFHLAHAALYLATAPKSNSALGYFDALEVVAGEPSGEVPNHLRDASRDKQGFGHGEGYLYPHAYRDHWVAQAYLPTALQGRLFYEPSDQGCERSIAERVSRRRELQLETAIPEESTEILSYSRDADRRLGEWIRRSGEERTAAVAAVRDRVASALAAARHHRVLIVGRGGTLHLWESVRSAPEGRVVVAGVGESRGEAARHYASRLPEIERPLIVDGDPLAAVEDERIAAHAYERIVLAEALGSQAQRRAIPTSTLKLATPDARLVATQRIPSHGQRLSDLLRDGLGRGDEVDVFRRAERELFADEKHDVVNWDEGHVLEALACGGWLVTDCERLEQEEQRLLSREQLDAWLDPDREAGLGAALLRVAGRDSLATIREVVGGALAGQVVPWRSVTVIIQASPAPHAP